jgi:hypothetical protein
MARKGRVRPRIRLAGSSASQAWRLGVLVVACTARGVRATDRSSRPCRFGGGGVGAGSQGLAQEDLEGERSPGRTVLALPVTNPVREARTRRWSKALKRPTLPVAPAPPLLARVGEGARPARGGPIGACGCSRWFRLPWRLQVMCGGRSSNRSARAHRIGGGVRCLRPAAKAVRKVPGGRWNRKKATAAVTRCGCRRGDSSRGTKRVARMAMHAATGLSGSQKRLGQQTRRTPGSAAGCNKPATLGDGHPLRWCETT